MPETYRLCEALKDRAFADESRWTKVGSVAQAGKEAASYRIQGFEDELYGRTYRFVVVESSALNQRKARLLPLFHNGRMLTGLPVQKLTDTMSISLGKERVPPFDGYCCHPVSTEVPNHNHL